MPAGQRYGIPGGMKHIREFDGLRGILALWVFATHVLELGPYPAVAAHVHANLAVDLFIILSGFVIFHLLSSGEDYRTFITRRWFRLFPVFAVCFLLALALYAGLGTSDETAFGIPHTNKLLPYLVAHATMLHGAVPDSLLPNSARAILVPAWSISVEWQFYLVAPLLFALAARPSRKPALVLCALVAARVLHDVASRIAGDPLRFDMAAFLPLRLEFFAVGIGSYGVWRWLHERNRPLIIPNSVYALVVPLLFLVAKKNPAVALWLGLMLLLAHGYFGTGVGVLLRIPEIFNSTPAQFLGKISYPIYLLHLPMLVVVRELLRRHSIAASAPAFQAALLLGGLAATIVGAWLLHVGVELPLVRLGKRVTAGWQTEQMPPLQGRPMPVR